MIDTEYLKLKISEINNRYPNINYGGCGTFSYHLHKVLKDKYNVDTDIFYIKSTNPPALKPDYDIKFSHILVKLGNHFIDNNGFYEKIPWVIDSLPIEKLEEMIKIPELWNNKFDEYVYNRDLTISRISNKMIDDIYKI